MSEGRVCGLNLLAFPPCMTNQGPDIVLIKSSDGSQVDTLRKTKGSIRFAEFSSDGKFLVAASDGEVITGEGGTLWGRGWVAASDGEVTCWTQL